MSTNRYRVILVLFGLACLVACASYGERTPRGGSYQSEMSAAAAPDVMVTVGMSKSDVKRKWGEPRDTAVKAEATEVWTYEFRQAAGGTGAAGGARAIVKRTIYRLTFTGDKLTAIDEQTY